MFSRKKEKQPISTARYGFSFSETPLTTCSDRLLSCAFKGLIIFAAVYGTLGGIISSFDLPHFGGILFPLLLLLSVAMAFIHYSRLIFNLCYPMVFLLFTFFILIYRFYVYSGFQAFINIVQEKYSTYFNLSILREANEYYSNRQMTITIATLFIGFFLIVLLNIAISEYMSLPIVILLTFPMFQLGIYIEEMPDIPHLILLLFSYIMVAILKRGEHFLLPYRDKKFSEFSFRHKNGTHTWRYHASGRMMLQLTALFFAFSLLVGIFALPFLSFSQTGSRISSLRKKTDEYVQILTQNGLAGFFNRYSATGGLSEGRLGGIASVRPDYKTDFTLTFVPVSYETVYLKAYTAQEYTGFSWKAPSYSTLPIKQELSHDYEDYEKFTAFLEAKRLSHYMDQNPGQGMLSKMKITNVDLPENYLFYPYYFNGNTDINYTLHRGLIEKVYCPVGKTYTMEYHPLIHDYWMINVYPDELLSDLAPDSKQARFIAYYDTLNTSAYINLPEDTRNAIAPIKEKIGTAANVDAQIKAIQKYLDDNYTYSMNPGTTPRYADFGAHFLTKQNSGYCAHFATGATLLLRSYGIPARYVEGYVVPFSDVTEGTALKESVSDYLTGTNPLGKSGVISVDVTDANAHAWVEVYKKGIGWVPYEFTPASSGSDTQYQSNNFWSLFAGIFAPQNTPETVTDIEPSDYKDSVFKKLIPSSFWVKPLLLFIVFFVLAGLIFYFGRLLLKRNRLLKAYRKGDHAPLLATRYKQVCKKLKQKGYYTESFLLPNKLPTLSFTEDQVARPMELLEKCCYSNETLLPEQADEVQSFLRLYLRKLKNYKMQ